MFPAINICVFFQPGYYCQGFAPVVDGDYIPTDPWAAREEGKSKKIPTMSGYCQEDGSPYTLICNYKFMFFNSCMKKDLKIKQKRKFIACLSLFY